MQIEAELQKFKFTFLISATLFLIIGIILIGGLNTVTGAAGSGPGSTPYMVSPYVGNSNIFGGDNTALIIAAIPDKTGPGTSKSVTEVRFNYFVGDFSTPTTLPVRDPSNSAIPKWIDTSDFFKEGQQWWTNISAIGFSTDGGFIFKNNNYDIPVAMYKLNKGVFKVTVDVDVYDSITGKTTTYTTPAKATYIRVN